MKLKYFYDGQFQRTLEHLIRLFGGFQVQNGFDAQGEPTYRPVPCRYADISRMASWIINNGSENTMLTAPMMTISVASLKMARADVRAPLAHSTVMGVNKSPAVNEYTKELDKQVHVERYNPVPWDFTFNVNVWTTTTTTKMELFEQIVSLFNPAIKLHLSTNPLDWTSDTDVELIDCEFTNRGVTSGTDNDLDIMTLTFKCKIWISLPALVSQPQLIEQIVTNLHTGGSELDIELEKYTDTITDVYTPKNMCVSVQRSSNAGGIETYEVTLVDSAFNVISNTGRVFSWSKYLKFLDTDYVNKPTYLKFQTGIEDLVPIKADVIQIGTDEEPNKLIVQVDTSILSVQYPLQAFITSVNDLADAVTDRYYISLSEVNIVYKGITIEPNSIIKILPNGCEVISPNTISGYVYNSQDQFYYTYTSAFGWHQAVMNKYRQGLWRIAIRNI